MKLNSNLFPLEYDQCESHLSSTSIAEIRAFSAPDVNTDAATSSDALATKNSVEITSLTKFELKIVASSLKTNARGKEIVSYIIAIIDRSGKNSFWCVEKLYSDFLALDHHVISPIFITLQLLFSSKNKKLVI